MSTELVRVIFPSLGREDWFSQLFLCTCPWLYGGLAGDKKAHDNDRATDKNCIQSSLKLYVHQSTSYQTFHKY